MKRISLILLSVLLVALSAFGCSAKAAPQAYNNNGYSYGAAADYAYAEEAYAPMPDKPAEVETASAALSNSFLSSIMRPI